MAKKNKIFKIFALNPIWDIEHQKVVFCESKNTLKEAIECKLHYSSAGFKKVYIKQRIK